MPVTILDYVKFQLGEQDSYSAQDCYSTGVDIMGGCEICAATIAIYNAYPSRSGYWRCADCIEDTGFATVEGFINSGTDTTHDSQDTGGYDPAPECDDQDGMTGYRSDAAIQDTWNER